MNDAIEIGARRELFVDDFLIDSLEGGAVQRLHHPQPREVIFPLENPWEGIGANFNTILNDGGKYRMYYQGELMSQLPTGTTAEAFGNDDLIICYAQSDDGIHWTKPELGIHFFNGSTKNNIVHIARGSHGFCPFIDTNPSCPPDEKYKAFGRSRVFEADQPAGEQYWRLLFALTSPDGLHWKHKPGPKRHGAILDREDGNFDSQNAGFWDEEDGVYRLYFRKRRPVEQMPGQPGEDDGDGGRRKQPSVRDIMLATSSDFLHWDVQGFLDYPGSPDEELYMNQIVRYPRAPHLFVGFPARYVENRGPLTAFHQDMMAQEPGRKYQSYTDGLFMSSRDGQSFHRWQEAFVRPLPAEQTRWGYGECFLNHGIIETPSTIPGAPSELSFFATEGRISRAACGIRRYTLRTDGFVSIEAPLSGGQLITKPFTFEGSHLSLNVSTSAVGSIYVELQSPDGEPVDGFTFADCVPMFGDGLEKQMRWKPSSCLAKLAGKPIRIALRIEDADVYAFQFCPSC